MRFEWRRVIGSLIFLGVVSAHADERKDEVAPSLELLEFLGEWQTRKGEFVDPMLLQGDDLDDAQPKPHEGESDDR